MGRVATPPGLQRDASTEAMRDIGEEMQQSWERAPPQPAGRAGFTPIALLRVVVDDRRRLPPCASLSDQILPARPHASSTTDCWDRHFACSLEGGTMPFSRR